jgi:autotransporter-associated beta strand protein
MKKRRLRNRGPLPTCALAALTAAIWPIASFAQTVQDVRIVTYNTQDDVSSPTPTGALPYLETVLEGVGQEKYVGDNILQLPDIIALQETTSNSVTVAPIVQALNSYYGSSVFNYSAYQATTADGVTDGGGPNALVYNQNTLNLIASVGVGTPGGGDESSPYYGEFRQVVRYEFQPIADTGTNNGIFYVYDSHYKSGSAGDSDDGSTDGGLRNLEAIIIRNDEAANLPANAAVLYVGDYNIGSASEAQYETLTAPNSPSGVNQGQAFDPLNPPLANNNNEPSYSVDWDENSTYKGILTESDDDLRYRDDLQTMTANVYNDTPGNLDFISGSYHAFGNNGSTAVFGNIDSPTSNPSANNSALNDIIGYGPLSPNTVLNAMNDTLGSDHLPVVADYSIALPSQNLTWDNAGAVAVNDGQTWDINHNLNWNSGSNASTYTQGSTVTFNDNNNATSNGGTNSNAYNVTLNTLVTPTSVTVNNSLGNYTISGTGTIGGTGALTKSGSATLTISTTNTYTGGTNVTAGQLIVAAAAALPNAGAVSISGNASMQLADNITAGSPFGSSNIVLSSLSIANNGTLNIGNNRILVSYTAGHDPIASIAQWIANGFNGSGGPEIISSDIATDDSATGLSYGIGYADGADGLVGGLPSGEIEIMYTLLGDANLDGTVNAEDYTPFSHNLGQSGMYWDDGDFNYDGTVNSEDYTPFSHNLGQSASLAAAAGDLQLANFSMVSVPEPASTGLLLLTFSSILTKRRRSRKS